MGFDGTESTKAAGTAAARKYFMEYLILVFTSAILFAS
jgi:hypothetical protein